MRENKQTHKNTNNLEKIVEKPGFLTRLRKKAAPIMLAGGMLLGSAAQAAETPPPLSAVEAVVPAANANGYGGSYWTTDLKALNTSDDVGEFTIYAVPNNGTYPDDVQGSLTETLSPGQSVNLENIVGQMGLTGFSGALFLDTTSGDIHYFTRTENTTGNGSVVGQGVAPLKQADALSPNGLYGDHAWVPLTGKLDNDGLPTDWRSNAYLVCWKNGTVNYGIIDEGGLILARNSVRLNAGQTVQINKIIELNNTMPRMMNETPRGIIFWTEDGAEFSAGVSIIDNRGAQDPTWFPATTKTITSGYAVAVSWPGANNSLWKTDTWARNSDLDNEDGIGYSYVYGDGEVSGTGYALAPGQIWQEEDIVAQRLKRPNTAGVIYFTSGGHMQIAERVYSEAPDGSTAGQSVPVITPEEALDTESIGYNYGLVNNDEKRTNAGFLNAAKNDQIPTSATLEVRVKDGTTGDTLKTLTLTLAPNEWRQLNNVFDGVYQGENGLLETRVLDIQGDDQYDEGGVIAYASTIANEPTLPTDQKHNDPSYQSATKIVTGPNRAPSMNDCIDDVVSPSVHYCGASDDYVIDGSIGASARGPPPAGPNLYHWGASDPEGDPITFNVRFVDLLNGQEWTPDYITVTTNPDSIDLNIDPDEGDIGDHFDMYVKVCDSYACSPEYTATFTINP